MLKVKKYIAETEKETFPPLSTSEYVLCCAQGTCESARA
jgi:hypothetical protein